MYLCPYPNTAIHGVNRIFDVEFVKDTCVWNTFFFPIFAGWGLWITDRLIDITIIFISKIEFVSYIFQQRYNKWFQFLTESPKTR